MCCRRHGHGLDVIPRLIDGSFKLLLFVNDEKEMALPSVDELPQLVPDERDIVKRTEEARDAFLTQLRRELRLFPQTSAFADHSGLENVHVVRMFPSAAATICRILYASDPF